MACLQADINFSTVALAAAVAKSLVGVKAPANQAIFIMEVAVSFDGATSSNPSVVVDLGRCTFATNSPGTASTTYTPSKKDPGRGETPQSAGAVNWTTEPTVITPFRTIDVPQFGGVYHYICPITAPLVVAGGQGFVVRANSPQVVNASGFVEFEE